MIYDINGNALLSAYDGNGDSLTQAYSIDGDPLMSSHAVSSNYTRSLILSNSDLDDGTQGIACDSITQTIAQLYTGNIYIFELDGSYSHVASVFNLGHGGAGQFAPTKTESQAYPLLYVSAQTAVSSGSTKYGLLIEVQCGASSSAFKRSFFAHEDDNLTGMFSIDFDNNIVYHVRSSSDTTTYPDTYITAWDFTAIEPTSDVSWTTTTPYVLTNKLKTFSIPRVNSMQSLSFFDGLIVLLSDDGYVQFVDPDTEGVYLTCSMDMPLFEREGVGFILNPETDQYDMVVTNRTGGAMNYYRYEFDLT